MSPFSVFRRSKIRKRLGEAKKKEIASRIYSYITIHVQLYTRISDKDYRKHTYP